MKHETIKTFKDVLAANDGKALEFTVKLADYTGRQADEEKTVAAFCWTDDPGMLDSPAVFALDASWQSEGGIGSHDNLHGELDAPIMALIKQIAAKFGGEWLYDAADSTLVQKGA